MSKIKILNKRCDWYHDPDEPERIVSVIAEAEIEEDGEKKFIYVDCSPESDDFVVHSLSFYSSKESIWPNDPYGLEVLADWREVYYETIQSLLQDIMDLVLANCDTNEDDVIGEVINFENGETVRPVTVKEYFLNI